MANGDLVGKTWVDTLNRRWNVIARAGPTSFMVERPTNDSLHKVTTIMTEVYIRQEIARWIRRSGYDPEPSIILQGSTKGSWAEMVMEDAWLMENRPVAQTRMYCTNCSRDWFQDEPMCVHCGAPMGVARRRRP